MGLRWVVSVDKLSIGREYLWKRERQGEERQREREEDMTQGESQNSQRKIENMEGGHGMSWNAMEG